MTETDRIVLLVVQAALVLFALVATIADLRIVSRAATAEADAEVRRGDKSMNALYTVYAAAMASFLVLIDKASGIDGNKVVLIVIDFLCLTYLFFFSTWFRNSVFMPLWRRVQRD